MQQAQARYSRINGRQRLDRRQLLSQPPPLQELEEVVVAVAME